MRKFRWSQLKLLNRIIVLGAVLVAIGLALIFAGHSLGIPFASIGGLFIVIRGYIRGEWFRDSPDDRDRG